jgi:hypothetical protein
MSSLVVQFAVYGRLCGGGADSMHAFNCAPQLQSALDSHQKGVVTISNESMGGDPCPGNTKFFGAIVSLDGVDMYFAGEENDTIDFFHSQDVAEVKKGAASKSAR